MMWLEFGVVANNQNRGMLADAQANPFEFQGCFTGFSAVQTLTRGPMIWQALSRLLLDRTNFLAMEAIA